MKKIKYLISFILAFYTISCGADHRIQIDLGTCLVDLHGEYRKTETDFGETQYYGVDSSNIVFVESGKFEEYGYDSDSYRVEEIIESESATYKHLSAEVGERRENVYLIIGGLRSLQISSDNSDYAVSVFKTCR